MSMTAPSNDVLTNIESDNRASCTQRFHLDIQDAQKERWLHLTNLAVNLPKRPGLAEIPGPVSITRTRTTVCQGFFPQRFESLCP